MWWTVTIPHRRTEAEQVVLGVQHFNILALDREDAAAEARVETLSPAATRHRRGASPDYKHLTVSPADRP